MILLAALLQLSNRCEALSASSPPQLRRAWERELPRNLADALSSRGINEMTRVQELAWEPVVSGLDAVVQSPTATGKTLAYVLPLCVRLSQSKEEESQQPRATKRGPARPRCVVLAPSRELTMQIGREMSKAAEAFGLKTATAYGGCPLERTIGALRAKGGADVVVSTPGRLAELARRGKSHGEKVLDFGALETFILDEADCLLDEVDVPEVQSFLFEEMDHDYQLVLFSATITDKVRAFAKGAMEVTHDQAFVDVDSSHLIVHTSTPVTASEWASAAVDVLLEASAKGGGLALVFTRSIADAKELDGILRAALSQHCDVYCLHGDLDGAARTKITSSLRAGASSTRRRVLVCTDVAARGIDLPAVDLVLQLGAPRKAGKEGTVDPDLYAHRAGRANRDSKTPAESWLLYDPNAGETKLVAELGRNFMRKPLPNPDALLSLGKSLALDAARRVPDDIAEAFALQHEEIEKDPLLLARALAALAGFSSPSEHAPDLHPRSILTGRKDRVTLKFEGEDSAISPTSVTKICKAMGSGKLGAVQTTKSPNDESRTFSAFVDIPTSKVDKVLDNMAKASTGDEHASSSTAQFVVDGLAISVVS